MAEQKTEAYKKKQEELRVQYEKEQELHENKYDHKCFFRKFETSMLTNKTYHLIFHLCFSKLILIF